jgi:osmotically inducible lipoprotein OsmB
MTSLLTNTKLIASAGILALGVSLSACATDTGTGALVGAGAGAAIGAAAGAPLTGALVGGAVGAGVGAISDSERARRRYYYGY